MAHTPSPASPAVSGAGRERRDKSSKIADQPVPAPDELRNLPIRSNASRSPSLLPDHPIEFVGIESKRTIVAHATSSATHTDTTDLTPTGPAPGNAAHPEPRLPNGFCGSPAPGFCGIGTGIGTGKNGTCNHSVVIFTVVVVVGIVGIVEVVVTGGSVVVVVDGGAVVVVVVGDGLGVVVTGGAVVVVTTCVGGGGAGATVVGAGAALGSGATVDGGGGGVGARELGTTDPGGIGARPGTIGVGSGLGRLSMAVNVNATPPIAVMATTADTPMSNCDTRIRRHAGPLGARPRSDASTSRGRLRYTSRPRNAPELRLGSRSATRPTRDRSRPHGR